MSFTTKLLLGVVIAVSLGILVYRHTFGAGPVTDADMDRYLAAASDKLNERLPAMVDSGTQLMSTTGMHRVLQYNYRLINVTLGQDTVVTLRHNVRHRLVSSACSNSETRDGFLKRGVTLRYAYTDRSGYDLFTFDITLRDCDL